MNASPKPSDADASEAGHGADRRLTLQALALLVVFAALAHVPLLLSDSIIWDSAPLANAIEAGHLDRLYEGFLASGTPQVYYLHAALAHAPDYVFAYKLTAYLCLVGATACIFLLCRTVPFLGLLESFAIAAIAAVYPFYAMWQELINVPYAVCYFLFFLGACCYSQYLSGPPKSMGWWLVLALPLFVASFATQSLLVYFYALFLFFFLRQEGEHGVAAVWRFGLRNVVALLMPVAFFLAVRWLFPTHGTYESYNEIHLSPIYLAKWLVVAPKRIALDQVKELRFGVREPLMFLAIAVASLSVLAAVCWAMWLPARRITARQFTLLFGFGILLFYLAVLPYAIVGKFPVVNTYTARHGLLAGVPIAIGIVAVLRFALRNDRLFAAGVGLVLLCCLILQTRSYILWQNRYIKYLAIVEHLRDRPDDLAPFVVLEDKADFGLPEVYRTYDVNWMTKRAYGNERHMGFETTNFNQEYYDHQNVPRKHVYCMSQDFRPAGEASVITIERHAPDSELGIYLGYLAAGAERVEFLKSLVDLSVRPAEVPFDASAPAPARKGAPAPAGTN